MNSNDKLNQVLDTLPKHVKLVAVSKTKPIEEIIAFYHAGHKIFGENKVQEIITKQPLLPGDIEWHFIGHLQRNKVKNIVPFAALIHGVDSFRLLKEINKQAAKIERIQPCLLQFHIATEETKFGLDQDEAMDFLNSDEFNDLNNISIHGVMGMATFTNDEEIVRQEFRKLNAIFHTLKELIFKENPEFKEISMGMSGDYKLAIEEGSTIVRIGSLLFGARNYQN